MGFDTNAVIHRCQGGASTIDLEITDPFGGVHDLSLEIGQIDPIVVDDPDRPVSGGGEVEQHR